ncbi:plasma-membrane choline transporter-domain-containing protein [Glomus cerebriforme]|uniref:Protein PNS1 n=1 Tax=Glomus cerebriforme TaxID=658196 RepID=A0A397SCW5_9GLOM|nr:plasma-membrane choline transporter-domain-containing protein [Glomus cerebriforme]
MFSQYRRNFQNRDSVFSESSEEPSASLFYSVPTLPTEAEIHESISLQTSRYEVEEEQENEPDTVFLSEHSPMACSNKQTAAEIYLEFPPTPTVKVSDNTLSEGLLPSSTIPLNQLSGASHRKYKDPAFAVLFGIGIIIMTIIGILLLFTTNSYKLRGSSHESVFIVIRDSIGPLLFAIIFSLSMGAIWILLLRSFVKVIIWGTLTAVPFICIAIFIWIRVEAFSGALRDSGKPDPQDDALAVLSFIPLIISIVYSIILYTHRKKFERTISLIQLACDIFKDNPQLLWVSLKILTVYVLFTIIWLHLFSRIFLVGYMQTEDKLEPNTYLLVLYFIFMYLWTSAVLSNIQRVTISGIVSHWYFYRHELDRNSSKKITDLALSRATTVSFGTVCLDGLIILFIQFIQYSTGFLKKISKNYPILNCLSSFLACIDGIIDNLNNYILIYVGISGKNFCSSAYITTKLFRRNLIFGLVNDFIAKSILYIGSVIIALLCGFATFIYATHLLQSPYGYVVGIIAAIIPYYVSQFYTYIMMSTVDATFICYTIDLDSNTNHCNKAHEAFH